MYAFMFFTSILVFYCGMIVSNQVLYLKEIESTRRLGKLDGFFGERSDEIKKLYITLFKLFG